MNLKTRIQLFSTLIIMIIIIIINTSIYLVFQKIILEEDRQNATIQLEKVAESLLLLTETTTIESFLRAYVPTDGMIRIINADNSVLFTSTTSADYSGLVHEYTTEQKDSIIQYKEQTFAFVSTPVIMEDGSIMMLELSENIESSIGILQLLRWILLISSLLVIIPTYFAGRVLGRFILNPIQMLIHTMENIQKEGNFQKIELKVKNKDELFQLGNTFNNMITLLEKQFNKQQQFVSDASHELKTPLTVIESYANMLKRWGKNRPDILDESIEAIYSEASRMKDMTNQMLALASADGNWNIEAEKFDLYNVCLSCAKSMETAYHHKIFISTEKKEIYLLGDKQKIKQLLFILLENGFKYGANKITIHLKEDSENISIDIEDNGIGIPIEDQPFVFERFYRVDKSRNRDNGGTGLGLSIAQKIMEAHSGSIKVISELDRGTSFVCIFPIATL